MPTGTHYSVLGVNRSASTEEIEAAYRAILLANHPDKIKHLTPFARTLGEARVRVARTAYEVLIDSEKAKKYDADTGIWESFGNSQSWRRLWGKAPSGASEPDPGSSRRPSGTEDSDGAGEHDFANEEDKEEEQTTPRAEGYTAFPTSSTNETSDSALQAEYRYGLTHTATDVDIKIKGWSLHLLLSTKFHFLNSVTSLPTGSDTRTIAFKFDLSRNKNHHALDTESPASKIPKLIIGVDYIQGARRGVGNMQTVLKETTKDSLTLSVLITSTPSDNSPSTMPPWKFGFDFDMNGHPAAWGRKRGTCMVFTQDRQGIEETPENVLKREDGLMAESFCGLGDEKLMGVKYKEVRMWRVVAVGYSRDRILEG